MDPLPVNGFLCRQRTRSRGFQAVQCTLMSITTGREHKGVSLDGNSNLLTKSLTSSRNGILSVKTSGYLISYSIHPASQPFLEASSLASYPITLRGRGPFWLPSISSSHPPSPCISSRITSPSHSVFHFKPFLLP